MCEYCRYCDFDYTTKHCYDPPCECNECAKEEEELNKWDSG
jgi:hypothetical protein